MTVSPRAVGVDTVHDVAAAQIAQLRQANAALEAWRIVVLGDLMDYLNGPYTPTKEALRGLLNPNPLRVAAEAERLLNAGP